MAFNHTAPAGGSHFPPRKVGEGRADMRLRLEAGSSVARGGTAFWDALIKISSEMQNKTSPWVIALTDGADQVALSARVNVLTALRIPVRVLSHSRAAAFEALLQRSKMGGAQLRCEPHHRWHRAGSVLRKRADLPEAATISETFLSVCSRRSP